MNKPHTRQMYLFDADEKDLDYRQVEVLSALSEDAKGTYSFQGLRRKLRFHQEMLSRTLSRLEEQELVERTNDGYRIINSNKGALRFGYITKATPIETQVVTAYLPREVNVSLVLNKLKGRWFREFRWLGYSETQNGLVLSWITDDGYIQIRANIIKNILTISALYESKIEQERAAKSAFELFDFINRSTRQISLPKEPVSAAA
ncbi:MAG: hypothetical protein WBF08_00035 [Candidatus Bathyarchaeia archaeon]